MKITIDFDNKEIILSESVNLVEFFRKLRTIIPEKEWKDYKVNSQYYNYTYTPIIIKEYPTPTIPYWYTTCNTILNEGCDINTTDTTLVDGTTQWSYTNSITGVYQFETEN